MVVIGIDPGIDGAMAVVDTNGEFATGFLDMPTVTRVVSKKKRRSIEPKQLYIEVERLVRGAGKAGYKIQFVMEQLNSGGKGAMANWSLGYSCGMIRGIIGAVDHTPVFVTPTMWKRHHGLLMPNTSDIDKKRAALGKARELYGTESLSLAKHHNRADAVLMARWFIDTQTPE